MSLNKASNLAITKFTKNVYNFASATKKDEDNSTLFARFSFIDNVLSIPSADPLKEAAEIKNEQVFSVLEFKKDELLIALESATLLLMKDWELVKVLSDINSNNDFAKKGYLSMLPGFN